MKNAYIYHSGKSMDQRFKEFAYSILNDKEKDGKNTQNKEGSNTSKTNSLKTINNTNTL